MNEAFLCVFILFFMQYTYRQNKKQIKTENTQSEKLLEAATAASYCISCFLYLCFEKTRSYTPYGYVFISSYTIYTYLNFHMTRPKQN